MTTTYDFTNKRRYSIKRRGMDRPSSKWSEIRCPFCLTLVKAYHWSLAGGGKKCTCGAKHDSWGFTAQPSKVSEK